ncbi:MAG: response regulator [Nitrospirae bacterium]|nr:MAG: response regulator [Nitrospirota bacterium]
MLPCSDAMIGQTDSPDHVQEPWTTATILIVDDEKTARMITRRRLERLGCRVLEVENGKEGLDVLRRENVDLVVCDWMMPEMDGPSLCDAIKADEGLRSVYVLLMTALDQPDQIAEGLRQGADDFLAKTASEQEIAARINAGLRTRGLMKRLTDSYRVIAEKQEELESELRSASEFVVSLLPPQGMISPRIELGWQFLPSSKLGGDLFQVVQWDEDYLGLMILDMSGHGIGPALRAVSLAMAFRPEIVRQRSASFDPGDILQGFNRDYPVTDQGEYFTMWLGSLHRPSRTLRYAAAGHPAAILVRADRSLVRLGAQTWPVGFGVNEDYATRSQQVEPGDRLYLYTDGLYEIFSPSDHMWGKEGLEHACTEAHEQPLHTALPWIVDRARHWQQRQLFRDDVALVGIDIQA